MRVKGFLGMFLESVSTLMVTFLMGLQETGIVEDVMKLKRSIDLTVECAFVMIASGLSNMPFGEAGCCSSSSDKSTS